MPRCRDSTYAAFSDGSRLIGTDLRTGENATILELKGVGSDGKAETVAMLLLLSPDARRMAVLRSLTEKDEQGNARQARHALRRTPSLCVPQHALTHSPSRTYHGHSPRPPLELAATDEACPPPTLHTPVKHAQATDTHTLIPPLTSSLPSPHPSP